MTTAVRDLVTNNNRVRLCYYAYCTCTCTYIRVRRSLQLVDHGYIFTDTIGVCSQCSHNKYIIYIIKTKYLTYKLYFNFVINIKKKSLDVETYP